MILSRILLIGAVVAACRRTESEQPVETAAAAPPIDTARPWRKPGDKIDSILPMPEYLRRFRLGLKEPTRFEGGTASRGELARRFVAAVNARDSAELARLVVTRAEFAWLVFPHHRYHNPPYELDPEIFWMQLTASSAKGLHRSLERYGGAGIGFVSLLCERDTLQVTPGPVKVWSNCTFRYHTGANIESRRLFGSIVERDGRMKLLSYANEF